MEHDTGRRDARMMNAVAGLGGRSALASEIDLRLGIMPVVTGGPGRTAGLMSRLRGLFRHDPAVARPAFLRHGGEAAGPDTGR